MIPYDYYIAYSGDNQLIMYMYHVMGKLSKTPMRMIVVNPLFNPIEDRIIIPYTGVSGEDVQEIVEFSMCYIYSPINSLIFWDKDTFTMENDNYDDCVEYILKKIGDYISVVNKRQIDYEGSRQEWYDEYCS